MARPKADVGGVLEAPPGGGGAEVPAASPDATEGHGEPRKGTLVLPTTPTAPSDTLLDKTTLIYGAPGIGKSTLASEFGKVLFLELEPGLSFLNVIRQHIDSWATFCEWTNALSKDGGKSYDAICIDTGDVLSAMCSAHTNAKLGIIHESQGEYGLGWSVAKSELAKWVNKLAAIPNTGLLIISHSVDVEIKTRNATYTKSIPTMDKKGREVFLNLADLVLFADFEDTEDGSEQRVLRTKPSRYWEAKERGNPPRLPETIVWPEGHGFEVLDQAWKGTK